MYLNGISLSTIKSVVPDFSPINLDIATQNVVSDVKDNDISLIDFSKTEFSPDEFSKMLNVTDMAMLKNIFSANAINWKKSL
jgi:hypothetical protein